MNEAETGRNDVSFLYLPVYQSEKGGSLWVGKILYQNDRFQHLDWKAANTIKVCAGVDIEIKKEEGRINMCKAIEDMQKRKYEEGRVAGEKQGISQGISQGIFMTLCGLVKDGILKGEDAAARAEMPLTEFMKKYKELGLS